MAFFSSSSHASRRLPDTSSARRAGQPAPSSTLRARLQSEVEDAPTISSPKRPAYPDVYEQFRACFATDPSHGNGPSANRKGTEKDCGVVAKLRESFARQGMKLHASAMEQLIQAHNEIQSRIDNLAKETSASLAECETLYGNIAYPLSATLCHTDNIPRATIATHLANLKRDVCSSVEELQKLGEEWDACVQTELEAWKELTSAGKVPKRGARESNPNTALVMASFKTEAQNIVNEKCDILTDLEREFKANVQSETLKIMKTMLDDSS